MRVSKYRDVIRTTFFGRNDKNLNDTTSIYNGFDRNQTVQIGGGISALTLTNAGTYGFNAVPNIILSSNGVSSNTSTGILSATVSPAPSPLAATLTITNGGTGFATAPTLYFIGGGGYTTIAAATVTTVAGGGVTATNVTNQEWL